VAQSGGRGRGRQNRGAPQKSRNELQRQETLAEIQIQQMFSGPLPHPDILSSYNEAVPDGAERILAMAERQAVHRQALETSNLQSHVTRSYWGLACGFILAMVIVIVGAVLALHGKTITGGLFMGVPVVALVGVFVIGSRDNRGERERRLRQLMGGLRD